MEPTNLPALPLNRPLSPTEIEPSAAVKRLPVAHATTRTLPTILGTPPNLKGLWAAFQRRWRLSVGLGLLTGAVAAVIGYYAANASSYTATTVLRVNSTQPVIVFKTSESFSEFATYQRSQVAALKTRMVLGAALREPKVAELAIVKEQTDPIEWLEKLIQADFNAGPELMRITATGKDPDAMLAIVDAVREVYLREIVNTEYNKRLARLELLRKLHTEKQDKSAAKRKVLRDLADDLGSGNATVVAVRHELKLKELNAIQMELIGLDGQIRRANIESLVQQEQEKAREAVSIPDALIAGVGPFGRIFRRQEQEPAAIPDAMIEEMVNKDELVVRYQKEIDQLDRILAEWKRTALKPDKEPGYQRDQKAMEAAKQALAARRAEIFPKVAAEIREQNRQRLALALAKRNEFLRTLKTSEVELNNKLLSTAESLRLFSKKANNYDELKEEIELVEGMAKRIGSECETLELEIQAPTRVTTLDTAYVVKRTGQGIQMAGASGLGGFAAVAFGICLIEFFYRRVGHVADVSRGLLLPVVGTLPVVRGQGGHSMGSSKNTAAARWQRLMIECVDTARTVLLHAVRQKNFRVVMVTSANGGEGKTMLSAHLAASLARAGWRVLLIDGDMRRPSLDKIFGIENQVGLGQVLRRQATLRDVVRPGPVEGLSFVPSGCADSDSMRALAQGELKTIIDGARQDYDFIIVDSAPILPVVDSQLMAQAVDGVILSVLQDVSRLPRVYEAYERLTLYHIDVLGVVIHSSSSGSYDSRYPYLPVSAAPAETTSPKAEVP